MLHAVLGLRVLLASRARVLAEHVFVDTFPVRHEQQTTRTVSSTNATHATQTAHIDKTLTRRTCADRAGRRGPPAARGCVDRMRVSDFSADFLGTQGVPDVTNQQVAQLPERLQLAVLVAPSGVSAGQNFSGHCWLGDLNPRLGANGTSWYPGAFGNGLFCVAVAFEINTEEEACTDCCRI